MKKQHIFAIVISLVLLMVLLPSCGEESTATETGIVLSSLEEETDGTDASASGSEPQAEAFTAAAIDEEPTEQKSEPVPVSSDYLLTMDNHFGFNPAFYDFTSAKEAGGIWTRPYFEMFTWGWIEPEPGVYTFEETDRHVKETQSYGFHIIANVQPRASWDEERCYNVKSEDTGMPTPFTEAHEPCDMEAYKRFVTALVERYDGDGIDDMPGLTVPIKHWEIMNEPEFPMYFLGTPAEYVDIVKASATAIKAADPDAVIVQGGMAGMDREMIDFWQQVIDLGVMEYFDVYNMHSIGHGEHLNIPAFKAFLTSNNIPDKPIWVTEVQYQQTEHSIDFTMDEFADSMARSYIFALASGVDKLFYVNLKMPEIAAKPDEDDKMEAEIKMPPFDERSALIDDSGMKTPLFYAHKTIAETLGALSDDDEVTVIGETVGDWFIETGQYKFVIGGETVYALWGSSPVPPELQGQVIVTDMAGNSYTTDSGEIQLTDSPVFVSPAQ